MRTMMLALLLGTTLASPVAAAAMASPEENPAKGTKNCLVWDPLSEVFAQVYPDGAVGLSVQADTVPRSKIYFLIDGKRYAGSADDFLRVDVEPLLADAAIDYSYSRWPTQREVIEVTNLSGFGDAYQQCVEFLRR